MKQWLTDAFQTLLADMINGIMNVMLGMLKWVMITPWHMDKLPGYWPLVLSLETVATSWLAVVLIKELFMNQWEDLNDMSVNPLIIFKNTLVSAVLIWASPLLVLNVILPVTGSLLNIVQGSVGNINNLTTDMISHLTVTAGQGLQIAALSAAFPEAGFWAGAFIAICFLILVCIVGFQNGKRWMELFYLVAVGPVMALSKASFGGLWDVWLKETLACAVAQVVQYFCIMLSFQMFLNGYAVSAVSGGTINPAGYIFLAIGAAAFAVSGPKHLRSILIGGGQPLNMRGIGGLVSAVKR